MRSKFLIRLLRRKLSRKSEPGELHWWSILLTEESTGKTLSGTLYPGLGWRPHGKLPRYESPGWPSIPLLLTWCNGFALLRAEIWAEIPYKCQLVATSSPRRVPISSPTAQNQSNFPHSSSEGQRNCFWVILALLSLSFIGGGFPVWLPSLNIP